VKRIIILIAIAFLLAACNGGCPAGSLCYTESGQPYQFQR
jgi:hypothetical protein